MAFFKFASARGIFPLLLLGFSCVLFSCRTTSAAVSPSPLRTDIPADNTSEGNPAGDAVSPSDIPVNIMSEGKLGRAALARFLVAENPLVSSERAERLVSLYIEECAAEGVNSDIAFAQMCLETGYLRFGGLVTEDMNNFCGLGATGPGQKGHSFPDERTGIRAHVQHLKGYGTHEPLRGELVDPRYKWISPKGRASDIFALTGTWAADPEYGNKIYAILARMYGAAQGDVSWPANYIY